jgi:hypothetical protein
MGYCIHRTNSTHVLCLKVKWFVPGRVEIANPAGKIGLAAISRFDIAGILGNAVVDTVKGFDEVLGVG